MELSPRKRFKSIFTKRKARMKEEGKKAWKKDGRRMIGCGNDKVPAETKK